MVRTIASITAAALIALSAGTAFAAPKVLKYGHFQPGREDQPKHKAALAFEACLEKMTDSSIDVQIFPAGQLGNATATLEGLKLGSIEMAVVHDGGISSIYPAFDIFALPYLFPNHETAYKVLDGDFGKEFGDAMLKETGIRLLAYADNGIRQFTNSRHPIKTPDDLKGLKMRVQPSPVYIALMESLGASPSAIDWGELPAALTQGAVDGQENGVTNIIAASLYQSQKYATLDGHVHSLHAYLISDVFYQGLTDAERAAIGTCTTEAQKIHRDMTRAQDLAAEKTLTEKGMEVYVPTADEIEAFRALAQPVVRKHLDAAVGPEWVDKLIKARDQAVTSQ